MIIDCIGCMHGEYPKMTGGDLLIITGDVTPADKVKNWVDFNEWLDKQDYKQKILIAGNHDNTCTMFAPHGTFTDDEYDQMYPGEKPLFDYLCNSGMEFDGLKIWGSPYSLWFPEINHHCRAFTGSETQLNHFFESIPNDTDILITHSPSYDLLDSSYRYGSKSLRTHVERVKPGLHVHSHIHEGYGSTLFDQTLVVNCSIMDRHYEPVNKPIRIIYDKENKRFQRVF